MEERIVNFMVRFEELIMDLGFVDLGNGRGLELLGDKLTAQGS